MATSAQKQKFILTMVPIAQEQSLKHNKAIFPSVCIAQACCESAYGTSQKMKNANALFGIKVGKSKYKFGNAWKGEAYSTKTKECYDGATYVSITDMFRAYDNVSDAVEDYMDMLCTCTRYKKALNCSTPLECITAIKNGGYATSPTYITTIMSIIKTFNLTQYDTFDSSTITSAYNSLNTLNSSNYIVGCVYTLQSNMYIREVANGTKVKYDNITYNAKQHATFDEYGNAVLKKGTRVTCQDVDMLQTSTWLRIPSGWICAISNNKVYVK